MEGATVPHKRRAGLRDESTIPYVRTDGMWSPSDRVDTAHQKLCRKNSVSTSPAQLCRQARPLKRFQKKEKKGKMALFVAVWVRYIRLVVCVSRMDYFLRPQPHACGGAPPPSPPRSPVCGVVCIGTSTCRELSMPCRTPGVRLPSFVWLWTSGGSVTLRRYHAVGLVSCRGAAAWCTVVVRVAFHRAPCSARAVSWVHVSLVLCSKAARISRARNRKPHLSAPSHAFRAPCTLCRATSHDMLCPRRTRRRFLPRDPAARDRESPACVRLPGGLPLEDILGAAGRAPPVRLGGLRPAHFQVGGWVTSGFFGVCNIFCPFYVS